MTNFTALYREHAAEVLRFAFYLSGNQADAEDITSETFVRAFASSDRIRGETMRAYLCTIARNLFLQGRRGKDRHAALPADIEAPGSGFDEQLAAKQDLAAVLEDLQRLPEVDRAALLLRALEEMPYEKIAAALSISVASAKVKVHRARMTLNERRSRTP